MEWDWSDGMKDGRLVPNHCLISSKPEGSKGRYLRGLGAVASTDGKQCGMED